MSLERKDILGLDYLTEVGKARINAMKDPLGIGFLIDRLSGRPLDPDDSARAAIASKVSESDKQDWKPEHELGSVPYEYRRYSDAT